MGNTRIVPMPESHTRLGIALETEDTTGASLTVANYGTFKDPTDADVIGGIVRVIDPQWGDEDNETTYNENWDTRLTDESHHFRRYKTLKSKHYFYVPASSAEQLACIKYYKALFKPAGLAESSGVFTLDDTHYTTVSTVNYMRRHGASIVLQEFLEGRKMRGARNNFRLNFATQAGLLVEADWMGMCLGSTNDYPVDMSADEYTKPSHLATLLDFASAGFFICTAADAAVSVPTDTYYLMCRGMTFDMGNTPTFLDDCNGTYGLGGIHIGNILSGCKVNFDVVRPYGHGTAIGDDSWPWVQHYLAGDKMYAQVTMLGNGTFSSGRGVRLEFVFQMDKPVASAADGLRRLNIGGTCKSATIAAATMNGFKFNVFDTA